MQTTPRFAAIETRVRTAAAGVALALTLGLLGAVSQVADRQYDEALTAAATDTTPMQFVVVADRMLARG